jgi:hypothetical protein
MLEARTEASMLFRKKHDEDLKKVEHHRKPATSLDGNGKDNESDDEFYYLDKLPGDIRKIIEIVNDTKAKLIELYADNIRELKKEIVELKADKRQAEERLWEVINKLVDKPTAPSAAQAYLASKQQNQPSTVSAGPKGKLP